jgi:hypothetical protein
MDGNNETAKPPKPGESFAETVLAQAQERGLKPPTTAAGADKPTDTAQPADQPRPLVDMADPKEAVPKVKDGKPTTTAGTDLEIVPGPPGAPDTTGDAKPGTAVKPEDAKPGDATAVKPADAKPGDATAVKPADAKPGDATAGDPNLKGTVTADGAIDAQYNEVKPGADKGDQAAKLPPEVEKDIAERMAQYRKSLDDGNFKVTIAKGEGPNPAMARQQSDILARQKKGEAITPQEKALLETDITTEARRVRDRDFKVFTDDKGKPRNWYITGESTNRWSEAEIKTKMAAQEQTLRQNAEKAIKEAAEKAKEAEAEKTRQALISAIEKNVPAEAQVKDAATAAGIQGLEPKQIRDGMMGRVAEDVSKELKAGKSVEDALKDLDKPYPRVGAALVGTGALTSEELTSALDKQAELKAAAEAKGEKGPRLDAVLQDIYKDNPEKLAKLDKGSKFYDELKKIVDADIAKKKAEAPVTAPFDPSFNEVPKPADKPADKPAETIPGPPSGPVEGMPPPAEKPAAAPVESQPPAQKPAVDTPPAATVPVETPPEKPAVKAEAEPQPLPGEDEAAAKKRIAAMKEASLRRLAEKSREQESPTSAEK